MSSVNSRTSVFPANLSFLTIYNPSLNSDDETLHDQILYYYSGTDRGHRDGKPNGEGEAEGNREVMNERLRQIGLAQGMVEFAKSFSNGDAVDLIETEKCRIILHELEAGWWILASINLTRIVSSSDATSNTHTSTKTQSTVEYSAREVCPPALVLQKLIRAHQIFLLHHASTLAELYLRFTRPKFCRALKRFWDDFILDWNVLLHGNPAVDVFNGIKLAAGGELGIGVGEEEWGCGEREVLEGFVDRTDGLVDLIVSRFGDSPELDPAQSQTLTSDIISSIANMDANEWGGAGQDPRPSDGIIFSGVGAITRFSIKAVSSWVELLYKYGKNAYGVRDNPSAINRPKHKRQLESHESQNHLSETPKSLPGASFNSLSSEQSSPSNSRRRPDASDGIPAPIVRLSQNSIVKTIDSRSSLKNAEVERRNTRDPSPGTVTLMKYLTLGVYGSKWGVPAQMASPHGSRAVATSRSAVDGPQSLPVRSRSHGHFIVGLQGDLDQDVGVQFSHQGTEQGADYGNVESSSWNNRTMLRTLQVERVRQKIAESSSENSAKNVEVEDESVDEHYYDRLRVVVYIRQPFIFTLLFELQTDSLAIPSFYHSLHHQLGPLQRPLLSSTSPTKVSERLREASAPKSTSTTENFQPIGDLVYDPFNLTVHTTIPNIPEPSNTAVAGSGLGPVSWTRVEALSVHSQILNTYGSTRKRKSELERTCKTNRGWWVVWMRLPHPAITPHREHAHDNIYREAFLIRKASDYVAPASKQASGIFSRGVRGSSPSSGWSGPSKLAEGIGIDAKQYIEGLLSLNR